MIVKCEKCPELVISDLGIVFKKGVAGVKDAKKIASLKKMQDFNFEFIPTKQDKQEPENSGSQDANGGTPDTGGDE